MTRRTSGPGQVFVHGRAWSGVAVAVAVRDKAAPACIACIYSVIALDDAEMKQIDEFGTSRYLIVPGDAHRLDAKIFKQRYPALQVIIPPGALNRVQKPVPVDATSAE